MVDFAGDLGIILTLVVLEAVLSFDNAAILAALSRKLPLGQGRRRALNLGMTIAYGLRVCAILLAAFLLKYPAFLLVGGAYLIFLCVKHFLDMTKGKEGHDADGAGERAKGLLSRLGISPFSAVILQIGFVDLAFALDQVVAAVGFTRQVPLIIVAAGIGLLSLRLLAPYISRLMDWLPTLEHVAYVAVGFVGVLLVIEDVPFTDFHYDMPKPIKVSITLTLFLVPILVKLVFKVPKSHPGEHVAGVGEPENPLAKP